MNIFSILMAIFAGIFTTLETSINAQLGKQVTAGTATLHSLITGTVFMLLIVMLRGNLPNYSKVLTVKPVWLIGGLFGAFIIYFSSRAIPDIGISNTLILILAGQLVSGLVIDACVNNVQISLRKMAGMILFLIGTVMFLKD
jgi:transporter family-2 protein